jgi:hypothetical protein
MAAQPKAATAPKAGVAPKVTAKQLTADRANLAKARAKEKGKPRTAKQKQASRQNLVRARAAQSARRAGKKFVTSKQAKAGIPDRSGVRIDDDLGLGEAALHSLPVCAAVAVAASLMYQTGAEPDPRETWALHKLAGASTIAGVIEAAAYRGLGGWRIAAFCPWDPDVQLDGLVYGIQLAIGYHAVLTVPGGMFSWDTVLPLAGEPEEAWLIEWEQTS